MARPPLTPEERRARQAAGGRRAQALGKGRRWTPEEARVFARKGGQNRHRKAREARP